MTIGLTIVALGTSAPEIFVGISSVLNGTESIAMGAVVGSNISNIALIFGVSCIGISMKPAKTNPIQFIPFILAVIVLGLGLHDLKITKSESIEFLFVFAAFMYFTYLFRIPDKVDESDNSNIKIGKTTLLLIFGLLALIVGSNYAVINAEKIAVILNVPQVIIGLTIIAIGTSLPELAATISAIIKNKNDMVIGNVIGSNVMNIALVVPIIGIFSDAAFESNILSRDFVILSVTSILFILVTATYSSSRFNLKVIKLIGYIFVIGYLGYILKLSNLI